MIQKWPGHIATMTHTWNNMPGYGVYNDVVLYLSGAQEESISQTVACISEAQSFVAKHWPCADTAVYV